MKYPVLLVCILAYGFIIHSQTTERPYNLEVSYWNNCGGQYHPIYILGHINKFDRRFLSGVASFAYPLDYSVGAIFHFFPIVTRTRNLTNAPLRTVTVSFSNNICGFFKHFIPGFFSGFTKSISVPPECPIPKVPPASEGTGKPPIKGTYEMFMWDMDNLSIPIFPNLPFGKYWIKVEFTKKNKIVGCAQVGVNITRV